MVARYSNELKNLIDNHTSDDFSGKINMSVALYFASYYHIKNVSCRKYLSQFVDGRKDGGGGGLVEFMQLWESNERARIAKIKDTTV